ncbi:hypothetical protein KHC33_03785 [Methanospirillum sp. J.3.6.1-F.2.7.3]|uniref:Type II toxin-antitoxin system RelE/ParE family toxin n=1 Tax=Methanospirillum purgamenti TaxID=2834276 RepID=A0A8E7B235_9EURY|nr:MULTISPECIES: hypothetical protein [Methanospirillum]MDX8551936.1 hypothetical protein [Methanospirillum hungatei]QVV89651.1 hypothetical protein KHC33_03785 [Methanospirillum sp. J.3.6.1-F.2.7.3]
MGQGSKSRGRIQNREDILLRRDKKKIGRRIIFLLSPSLCHLENPALTLKKLKSPDGVRRYSLRVGIYQVTIRIEQDTLIIIVLDAGHRKHVYHKY